jgi:hypothetical protein
MVAYFFCSSVALGVLQAAAVIILKLVSLITGDRLGFVHSRDDNRRLLRRGIAGSAALADQRADWSNVKSIERLSTMPSRVQSSFAVRIAGRSSMTP